MSEQETEPDIPIQNYGQRQIMVSFAYLAYSGEQITSPQPEQTILDLINAAMPKIPPISSGSPSKADWAVVWGPATYTVPGSLYQDNMTFVVRNIDDPAQLVVATRGTNGVAKLDWMLEDFDVLQMMPWPAGASGSAVVGQISESTSIDLEILRSMKSRLNGNTTLLEFLGTTFSTYQGSTPSVCVTGHSKGGTLSSTLALYLRENQADWAHGTNPIVSNVSFAGPTAGNTDFATHSDGQFDGGPYPAGWDETLASTCDRVHNSFDVAPLVWDYNQYDNIIGLYDFHKPFHHHDPPMIRFHGTEWDLISGSVQSLFQKLLAAKGYSQIKPQQAALKGTFDPDEATTSTSLPKILAAYATEAGVQHHGYPTLLGVPELLKDSVIVLLPPT